jgi:ribosomal protein S18 acetylase RimI-like enzyme
MQHTSNSTNSASPPDIMALMIANVNLGSLIHSFRLNTQYGGATSGSFGVRGFISEVHGRDHLEKVNLLNRSLEALKEGGVRRVHMIMQSGGDLESVAKSAGFKTCPGESLFQRVLDTKPMPGEALYPGFTLRDGTLHDLFTISTKLTHIPELAFQGWEMLLIGRQLGRQDRFFKVIEHHKEIVGVSIGGLCGDRGTISHTWVAPEHRNHKLGRALSEASLTSLYDGGASIAHLMTTPGNEIAERFWERQGFVRETRHQFLEIDI